MSQDSDRSRMETDEGWMYDVLQEANADKISGAFLQNMVNQYFFADILEREQYKGQWVRRVMHPRPPDEFFPPGARTHLLMKLACSDSLDS